MQGKVCVVTGASRGIGRAITEGLARMGATVVMVCRDGATGEAARSQIAASTGNPNLSLLLADFAVQADVRRLAEEIKARHRQLHVLVNNAGVYHLRRTKTPDNIETTFAVNHLASFILTNALIDLLKASAPARIVTVASEAHQRVADPEDWEGVKGYNGTTAYNRSKLANVMFTYDLAHRLEGTGVTVNGCHPGVVATPVIKGRFERWWTAWLWPFIEKNFTISPEEAAQTPLYLATSPDVEGVTGKYFKNLRPTTSSLISHDAVLGARLWNISLRLTGELPPVEITGEHIAV